MNKYDISNLWEHFEKQVRNRILEPEYGSSRPCAICGKVLKANVDKVILGKEFQCSRWKFRLVNFYYLNYCYIF